MNLKTLRMHSVLFLILTFVFASPVIASASRLQLEIANCQVEKVRNLLDAGADPHEKDFQGEPIIRWFASNSKCSDSTALATAKLLEHHGASFKTGIKGPSLLVNLAPRRLPKTRRLVGPRSARFCSAC